MDSYTLSRAWFNWSFENPEKISPGHSAIYFFAIEHCNRLGWKDKFGFPTQMAMDALGIKKHQTYTKYLNDLVEWGFLKMVQKSYNQYSANIISLSSALPKNGKALDKATLTHWAKQGQSTGQSKGSINKQINQLTIERINNEPEASPLPFFSFKKSLIEFGFLENLVDDWLKVRKLKKSANTETALKSFISEVEKCSMDKNEVLKICVEKSWCGFKKNWIDNLNNNLNNGTKQPNHGQSAGAIKLIHSAKSDWDRLNSI